MSDAPVSPGGGGDPLPLPPVPPRRAPRASLLVLGAAALIITLDVVFPEQITVGVLYVLPVVLGLSLDSERLLYILTAVVIAAIFTLFIAFPGGDVRIGLINRALTSIVMLGVAYLVARQMRTRRELAQQRRQLANLMVLQTDFVRAVSHDIRAPIGAVLGYVELLESSVGTEPLSPAQSRILAGIERSSRAVVALTDNLLTTARLDAGDFPVEHAPFDLAALARDVAAESASSARHGAERVRVEAPPSLPMVCDALRVRQILMNLLSNALKYSPADREVTVVVGHAHGIVRVSVIDRGHGIPADEQERIFEPFYQSAGRRKRAGVGLGLPLARRLARILGGDLTLRSVVGEGSEFVLELPEERGKRE